MAIQNLRSSSAHKRPIPTVLSAGQIAVNTNQASPGLFFKDSNGDLVKVGPVHIGTSAPNSSPATTAADALVSGTVYQILTVGNTDFTAVGASANTVGVIFTATGAGTGTGTVSGQQGNEKGEQWLDTSGGAYDLKIYDGSAWRSQAGEFVNHTGDTMTGVLQFVSGSASAPGIAFSGDTNTGIFRPGADSVAVTTGGTQRLLIDSSGSATFAANITSSGNYINGINTGSTTTSGVELYKSGVIYVQRTSASADSALLFSGYKGSSENVAINAGGSATFAGTVQATDGTQYVKAYETGFVQANRTNGANFVFEGRLSNSTTSSIKGDGSAAFKGDLTLGSYNAGSNGVRGLFYTETAGLTVQAPAGTTQSLFKGLGGSSSDVKFNINADGSAEFASNIETGNYNASSSSGQGVVVYASGALNIQRAAGASVDARFQIRSGDTQVVAMNNDGSATFGQASNSTNNNGILLGGDVGQFNLYTTRYSTDAFQILNTSGSGTNVAVRFDGDGSATFAGRVNAGASNLDNRAVVGYNDSNTAGSITANNYTSTGPVWQAYNASVSTSTPTSTIYASGSATFAGGVTATGNNTSSGITVNTTAAGKGVTVLGSSGGDIRLKGDGSATFTGGVQSLSAGNNYIPTIKGQNGATLDQIYVDSPTGRVFAVKGNGSAEFASNVDVGAWKASNNSLQGARIYSTGYIQSNRTSSSGGVFTGSLSGSVTSQILADGSARFDGAIGVGTTPQDNIGKVFITESPAATGKTLLALGDGNAVNGRLKSDGSATFAGDMVVGGTTTLQNNAVTTSSAGYVFINRGSGAGLIIQQNGGGSSSDNKILLSTDGSATFSGPMSISDTGGNSAGQAHTTGALNCNLIRPITNSNSSHNGTYFLSRNAAGGGAKSVGIVETGLRVGSFTNDLSAAETIKLNTNGSASFAGSNFAIGSTGAIAINRASSGNFIIEGKLNGSQTSLIRADGSAVFNGVLQGDQRVVINGAGGKTGSANTLLNYAGDGSTVTASFTADGAANFASQQFRIASSGELIIDGSASAAASNLFSCKSAYNSGNEVASIKADGKALFSTDVTVSSGRFDSSVGSTSSYLYIGRLGSLIKYHVLGDGSAYFAGNITAGNVSDIKFKENITDANPQLSDVVALGGILKNWDWKAEAPLNEELRAKRFLGLVAQEAEVICPGVTYEVSRTIQGEELTPETTDEEGNVTPATYEEVEESYKAINHDILVMKLLGAVAELTAKNDTLEAKVAALEAG